MLKQTVIFLTNLFNFVLNYLVFKT